MNPVWKSVGGGKATEHWHCQNKLQGRTVDRLPLGQRCYLTGDTFWAG